ncbi:DNA alkylation repair protein [Flammeovirga yaeyamensis]|uniref:DNA alkylation repair protein n=1 Tax=Flammeovirga yaeyamensis TaxID=367791 RepID=A0AAX1N4C3_9BACT|nr:DNA alkylation repair protein [Flammeovirga yaeyamensis]MBB3701432.1 3-methyladenine DNA glycosylase AlkD [Flammeovirga yaeyamensis]NMF38536.1 DNA alkylation repair protein [Flammeovirga yaeyamensis]QWG02384.1 DNA alkylation repair protein [Flammeovirga yaeyamensis]
MKLSEKTQSIYDQINSDKTKLGDIKKLAKEIKKDHEMALELWTIPEFFPRQLAILILDKAKLDQEVINQLDKDIQEQHPQKEKTQMIDWLMANQLTKNKKLIGLMESWEDSPSALQRRLFWYYQARLRWTGKTPPSNSKELIDKLEADILNEPPEVQWAMNFTAAWIGIYEKEYRDRCISIGENIGLYKEEKAPKGCTPNYLPEFIRIETSKRGL